MALACDFEDPRAPPVKIFNEVDPHVEPHPKFEFLWTNKVILGQDVPKSSRENLKGCGCFGKCDPQSRSCFCVKRQMKNCPELKSQPGFAYDLDETLKWVDYPVVFECNDECDCDPDCPNRVVQRGRRARISIKKTKNKGWGVFAQEHIKEHQFIGIYSGELITENEAEARGIMYGDLGRTYLFDLDFESVHMIKERLAQEASEAAERATRSNHKVKKQRAAGSPSRTPLQEDSGSSSGTRVNSEYTVDAFYVGNHTRYLNHSCSPNCFPVPVFIQESDLVKPLICLFTIQEVHPHEELTFSYFGEATRALQSGDEDQRSGRVFVKCECGADQCIGIMFG
ncbi:uncharacterized protein EI90DRAFT_3146450 [Cantharellus anzutake]|uniref:uncharacterized protein n=1 Tax=Cantharellus anzutake TaxID=1750568 RepID=UPI001908D2D0|nr:uncharacterized protein EI90DRAFT_3146450 [Cantharellus anzutake]KAF8326518.1 hypothetical protein EI90DRAFT_3146450 [Cantharellus anzutake]